MEESVPTRESVPTESAVPRRRAENSTVFVGGLDPTLTEPDLRTHFEAFGDLVYVKIPAGKGCGFVQFTRRADAEASIQALNGTMIGASRVRLSWVRSGGGAGRHAGPVGMSSPYGMGPYGGYPPYAMAGAYGVDPSWAAAQAQYAAAAQYASMQAAYYGGAAAGMAHGAPPPPPPMPVTMPGTPGGRCPGRGANAGNFQREQRAGQPQRAGWSRGGERRVRGSARAQHDGSTRVDVRAAGRILKAFGTLGTHGRTRQTRTDRTIFSHKKTANRKGPDPKPDIH